MAHCVAPEPLVLMRCSRRVFLVVVGLRIAPWIGRAPSTGVFLLLPVRDWILHRGLAPNSVGLGLRRIRSSLGIAVSGVAPLYSHGKVSLLVVLT